jgi:hypothetical protein
MPIYTVKLNGQMLASTDWPPLAQTAWNRASRDRDSAQHGGKAELWVDTQLVASVQPETLRGHRWPMREVPECGLRDVFKAMLLLLRDDGWDAKEIADAMTAFGLPTTRSRIDALRGSTAGKRTEVCAAEIVTMLYALLNQYKKGSGSEIAAPK